MRFVCLIISFCFLFEGCAVFKKRKNDPELIETASIARAIDSALKTPDFTEGKWPAANWWTLFEDEQLSRVMEVAIEKNPDLQAAVSRMRAAQQEAQKVRSSLLPHMSANFDENYQHLSKDSLFRFPPSPIPAVVNQIDLALNFEYEIDLFGKNRNRYRAAIGEARARAAETSEALLIITATLAETYFSYASNLQNFELSQDLARAQKSFLELTELRFENGLGDQRSVDQAAAKLLEAEERVVLYEKEITLNRNQMKILMGLSPDDVWEFGPPDAHFDRPFPLPENIPLNLLARRPDLMTQIWNVEAAAHLINAAKAAFFPNINLAAFVGWESLSWNNLFKGGSYASSLAPAIHLPIFTGGRLTAHLNERYAYYDAAVYQYNSLLLSAAKEVSDQIKILEAANEESRLQGETVSRFVGIFDLTHQRYTNGLDDYLTVLERQIDTLNQEIKKVGIQNKKYISVLQLVKALGGGYQSHDR